MDKHRKKFLLATITVVLALASVPAYAAESCTVNDRTGTPLNVRARPSAGGPILGALNNDVLVVVRERRGQWARIVTEAPGKSGWVFGEYLSCGAKSSALAEEYTAILVFALTFEAVGPHSVVMLTSREVPSLEGCALFLNELTAFYKRHPDRVQFLRKVCVPPPTDSKQ